MFQCVGVKLTGVFSVDWPCTGRVGIGLVGEPVGFSPITEVAFILVDAIVNTAWPRQAGVEEFAGIGRAGGRLEFAQLVVEFC